MQKHCIRCNIDKDVTEFYKHKAMADGYVSICKECKAKQVLVYRLKNKEKIKEYDRNRPNKLQRYADNKKRLQKLKESNPDEFYARRRKSLQKWRNKDKRKSVCEGRLNYAIQTGKIIKPNKCERCNIICSPEGHHYDYDKPLDVMWLCVKCHHDIHKEQRDNLRSKM